MSQQLSLAIMAICMIIITLSIMVMAVAVTVLALRTRKSVVTLTNRAGPLISQATETVKTANGVVQSVKAHTDGIMEKAETTVDSITRKVKTTTDIVQESISPPIITAASVMTGVSRGLEALSHMRRRGGNGHAK